MALGPILTKVLFFLLIPLHALAIGGGSLVGVATPHSCSDGLFLTDPGAANTTTTTAVIYQMTTGTADLRVRHSTEVNGTWTTVGPTTTVDSVMEEIDLTSLTAGTEYFYHVDCRLSAAQPWVAGPLQRFHTQFANTVDASFVDVITADAHWVGEFLNRGGFADPNRRRGCYFDNGDKATYRLLRSEPFATPSVWYDTAENSIAMAALDNPVNYFSLGDFAHTQHATLCQAPGESEIYANSGCCWSQNIEWGSIAASDDDPEEHDIRIRHALNQIQPLRKKAAFWLARGNHDNPFGPGIGAGGCRHFRDEADLSVTRFNAQMPNVNDVYPVNTGLYPENAASFSFDNGQVTYVLPSEYESVCEGGTCDATTNMPNSADDWTIGANQKTWMSGLTVGKVVIVMNHHMFGGIQGSNICYWYGRASPWETTDGELLSPWVGDEEWLHQEMKTWADAGKTVIRLVGHDHRFGFIKTRDNVHYFSVGRVGMGPTSWADGGIYFSDTELRPYEVAWDNNENGTVDWHESGETVYAPQAYTDDFDGWIRMTYVSSPATTVKLEWVNSLGEANWEYTLTPSSVVRVKP